MGRDYAYTVMALAAGVGVVARTTLADVFCVAAAPVGAVLVALCLLPAVSGQTHVGCMVGVGCSADQRFNSIFTVLWLYDTAPCV